MKAADFAISRILPEDLRQPEYDLSKKGVAKIMAQVAAKYPERFSEISKKLGDLGRNAAWYQGYTTSAADTKPVIDTRAYYERMDAELADLRRQKLAPAEFEEQRNAILMRYSDAIDRDTMKAALGNNNAFARAVASGARGNPAHVKAILSTPGIYSDAQGNIIPLFVRNSFAQGVRPAETLAGTYGARLAVTSTKKATAKGGDLAKILNQSTSNYNITEKDCGVNNGIDLTPDDDSLNGRVLARPLGDLPAGTVIDNKALGVIRKQSKPVIVRSAMTCKAEHGLCAKCAGLQANGKFPAVGESIGITAGHAISEPIVQGSLNCLAEGTLVRMADYSVRPIALVRPGEKVLGADIHGNTFPVEVLALHDQGMQPVQTYTYKATEKSSVSVTCTADHPILQTSGNSFEKRSAGVEGATSAVLATGDKSTAPRSGIEDAGVQQCWDLSVDHPDELFVLHNMLIVKNTKHNAGMAKGKKSFSGFDYISQFVQVPDDFRDRAAVSEVAGMVEKIEEAPQGGSYIYVDGQQHFALPGFAATVKVGDKVEPGDQLSEGLVNPSDIVRLRGLGEGRRYYAERLGQILSDSGNPPDKRNMEIIARATVDTYRAEDPDEDSGYMPDESVREREFLKSYTPPADTAPARLDKAVGSYLQQPVLHYTVGTKLTPKMIDRMRSAGVEEVLTSRSTPWFKPEMKRLRVASHDSKDWLVSLGTSYLSSQMQDALERGDETNVRENYHFGPRLAFGGDAGSGGFGDNVATTGKF